MYIILVRKSSGAAWQPWRWWPHDWGLRQDDLSRVLAAEDHVVAGGEYLTAATVGEAPELREEALQGIGQLLAGSGWHQVCSAMVVSAVCMWENAVLSSSIIL